MILYKTPISTYSQRLDVSGLISSIVDDIHNIICSDSRLKKNGTVELTTNRYDALL